MLTLESKYGRSKMCCEQTSQHLHTTTQFPEFFVGKPWKLCQLQMVCMCHVMPLSALGWTNIMPFITQSPWMREHVFRIEWKMVKCTRTYRDTAGYKPTIRYCWPGTGKDYWMIKDWQDDKGLDSAKMGWEAGQLRGKSEKVTCSLGMCVTMWFWWGKDWMSIGVGIADQEADEVEDGKMNSTYCLKWPAKPLAADL